MARNAIKKLSVKLKRGAASLKQKAKTAKNVVHSIGKIGKQFANPKNIYDSIRKPGIILPGSKYIGPGNRMGQGRGVDEGDRIAKQHDKDYTALSDAGAGKNVYTRYSKADERAFQKAKKTLGKKADAGALAVAAGMGAKKLANKIGLVKKLNDSYYLRNQNKVKAVKSGVVKKTKK